MYLSVSSYTWLPSPLLSKVALLGDYGIESVELFSAFRHLDISDPEEVQRVGMALRKIRLREISMHAPSSVGDLSAPGEDLSGETRIACQKTLDSAMLMGASLVTFHPASIECEAGQSENRWEKLSKTLKELSLYADDRDLRIAVENFQPPLFGSDPKELYETISDIDLPNVGLSLNLSRAFVGGHLPAVLSSFGDKIFAVQASDNRGRADDHLPPGQGRLPWEEIFDGLRQCDYRGPFIVEVRQDRPTEDILEDIVNFAERYGLSGVGQLSH